MREVFNPMEDRIYTVCADGICEPNPGQGCWAFIVYNEKDEVVHQDSGSVEGWTTNNVAEYFAVGKALKWMLENHPEAYINLFSDSQLVLKQISGQWECNKDNLRNLRDRCRELAQKLNVEFLWVSGEDNPADVLTRVAYLEATGKEPPVRHRKQKTA